MLKFRESFGGIGLVGELVFERLLHKLVTLLAVTCFLGASLPAFAAKEKLALVLDQSRNLDSPEWEDEVRRLVADAVQNGDVNNVSTNEFRGKNRLETCIEFRSERALREAKYRIQKRMRTASKELRTKTERPKLSLAVLPSCVESKVNFIRPVPKTAGRSLTTGIAR